MREIIFSLIFLNFFWVFSVQILHSFSSKNFLIILLLPKPSWLQPKSTFSHSKYSPFSKNVNFRFNLFFAYVFSIFPAKQSQNSLFRSLGQNNLSIFKLNSYQNNNLEKNRQIPVFPIPKLCSLLNQLPLIQSLQL